MNSAPSVLKSSVLPGLRSSAFRLSAAGCLLASVFCLPAFAQTNVFPASGNVGIGTTSPRSRLDLGTSLGAGNGARLGDYLEINEREVINNALAIGWNAHIAADDGTFAPTYAPGTGMVLTMVSGGLGDLDFYGKNWAGDGTPKDLSTFTHVMRLSTNGNVGIGTTNPSYKMEVSAGDTRNIYLDTSNYPKIGTTYGAGSGIELYNGSTGAMTFTTGAPSYPFVFASGNVGIGTANPTSRLHVYELVNAAASYEQLGVEQEFAAPATATHYIKALDIEKYRFNIPDGITSNGYQIGIASQVYVSDPNFAGTIANQYGIWSRTGIYSAAASGARTIQNAYGIYLEGLHQLGTINNHYGVFQTGSGTKNYFEGNVGIGTTNPTHKLAVNGTIRAKEVIVDTGWADYVFADDYRLAPLSEVEAHIREKKHLPGIPSAAEVTEHGVNMGEMQAKFLAKLEEVTLHLIRMEKENAAQSLRLAALEQENGALRQQLSALNSHPSTFFPPP